MWKEKLQNYYDKSGMVDIKFDIADEFRERTDLTIDEKVERICEITYKILTGEIPSTDVSDVDF